MHSGTSALQPQDNSGQFLAPMPPKKNGKKPGNDFCQDIEYNEKIYWMTPLGKALNQTIEEMNIREGFKDKIKE